MSSIIKSKKAITVFKHEYSHPLYSKYQVSLRYVFINFHYTTEHFRDGIKSSVVVVFKNVHKKRRQVRRITVRTTVLAIVIVSQISLQSLNHPLACSVSDPFMMS